MLFNSLTYMVFFLVVLAGYWALPWHRPRLVWLLLASWTFYAAWYPLYLILFLAVTGINYAMALAVGATRTANPRGAKWIIFATAAVNLGCLGLFKYCDFFVQTAAGFWRWTAGSSWRPPLANLILPLGISFYTFQLLGYVVDVYRGVTQPVRNPMKVALFKAFFPQLIAGPILRANQFLPQLASKRRFILSHLLHGMDLIAIGLFKKMLVADQLSSFVEQVFASPDGFGAGTLLLGVYAYAAQIYCDFSGYTDIGRGCAYCLGYELPANFRHPYFSCNIVEFWRRWHITLSNWLRDYLYISLGGNRHGAWKTYRNLMITMALGGLWHGASWNFVVWGVLHGVALCATRFVHERRGVKPDQPLFGGRAYRAFAVLVTFHLVCLGWIFFRAPTFDTAFRVLRGLASFHLVGSRDVAALGWVTLSATAVAMAAFAAMHYLSARARLANLHATTFWAAARPLVYFGVTAAILLFAGRGAQQFIYFQF